MNRLMKYVFTKREKFLLVVLVVLALGAVWYCGIYAPLEARIRAADTTDLEDEISLEQIKAQKLQAMQAEIDENKAAGLPELQTYNYFKNEVEELNQIFSTATDFNFSFSEPVADGNTVRRDVSVSFGAKNYEQLLQDNDPRCQRRVRKQGDCCSVGKHRGRTGDGIVLHDGV